jgi:hypothetical protein
VLALDELLRKVDAEPDLDRLRESVRVMTQMLMESGSCSAPGKRRAYQRTHDQHGERSAHVDGN